MLSFGGIKIGPPINKEQIQVPKATVTAQKVQICRQSYVESEEDSEDEISNEEGEEGGSSSQEVAAPVLLAESSEEEIILSSNESSPIEAAAPLLNPQIVIQAELAALKQASDGEVEEMGQAPGPGKRCNTSHSLHASINSGSDASACGSDQPPIAVEPAT